MSPLPPPPFPPTPRSLNSTSNQFSSVRVLVRGKTETCVRTETVKLVDMSKAYNLYVTGASPYKSALQGRSQCSECAKTGINFVPKRRHKSWSFFPFGVPSDANDLLNEKCSSILICKIFSFLVPRLHSFYHDSIFRIHTQRVHVVASVHIVLVRKQM